MKDLALGIDIGGTNTDFGLIDHEGNCIYKSTCKTTHFDLPEKLAEVVFEDVNEYLNSQQQVINIVGVGIGAPNGNYFSGTIEFAPNLNWNGIVNLSEIFGKHFSCPIFVTNDANAAAIGEMQFGAAKDCKDFFMVTLGTGLGSAFIANGQMIYGHDGFAGELGHTIVEQHGRPCGCGRKGCLETYASATGVVRTAKIFLTESSEDSLLRKNNIDQLTTKDISEAAKSGDQLAMSIFEYTAHKLAFSLANTIAITSPQKIIFSGGLSKAGELLFTPTAQYMEDNLLNIFQNKVKLEVSSLQGDNVAILGAGALVWKELPKQQSKNG